MSNASTHTGICQACGRRQAVHVKTGMIAKHGYTTEYGFFNGTCGGSDALPLELDTEVNVATVEALIAFAAKHEAKAEGEIRTVPVTTYERDAYGRRKEVIVQVGPEEYATRRDCYGRFEEAAERVRSSLRRVAERVRADAADLEALRDRVHGQPLQPRAVEVEIKREYFKNAREAYVRQAELKAQGIDARIRRNRYMGQPVALTYR